MLFAFVVVFSVQCTHVQQAGRDLNVAAQVHCAPSTSRSFTDVGFAKDYHWL